MSTPVRGAIKWKSLALAEVSTFRNKKKNDELDVAQSRIMATLHGVYTTKTNSNAAKMGRFRSAAEAADFFLDIKMCIFVNS